MKGGNDHDRTEFPDYPVSQVYRGSRMGSLKIVPLKLKMKVMVL